MDKIIKLLKIALLLVGIVIGLAILGGIYFVVQGIRSGDLTSYVQKTAVESFMPKDNLTPYQKKLLEEGNVEALVEDVKDNLTQEQINCAVQAVGEKRANELLITNDPTPQEILKLSKCL